MWEKTRVPGEKTIFNSNEMLNLPTSDGVSTSYLKISCFFFTLELSTYRKLIFTSTFKLEEVRPDDSYEYLLRYI